jgi:D-alanyl-D-alanine dipeptidase
MRRLVLTALFVILAPLAFAGEMPKDFVYLRDVDPTIVQDMRYAGADNFVGRKLPGYDAPECVLVRQAADALKAVQAELKPEALTLKVYDCFRPARAVQAFVAWSKLPDDPKAKATYYPGLSKQALFPDYIAFVSGHSRGATMDLTLVPIGETTVPPPSGNGDTAHPCTGPEGVRAVDSSLDMGTSFDCLDVKANTITPGLTPEQRSNRERLVAAMQRHGFTNYAKEWWHFTLAGEPYPDTIFDFPILPRAAPADEPAGAKATPSSKP